MWDVKEVKAENKTQLFTDHWQLLVLNLRQKKMVGAYETYTPSKHTSTML